MADLEKVPGASGVPALRASDRDRERTTALLRAAATRGQLETEELEDRLGEALSARTREQLRALTADLPADDLHGQVAASDLAGGDGSSGSGWVVSVMSGTDRRGHWRVGGHLRVVSVMGGSEVDLSEAELTAPVTTITVVSVMGGAEVRVPDGVRVEVSKLGIMGGNDVKLGTARAAADAPLVRVRLLAFMGGNEVRQGRRRRRRERRQAYLAKREARLEGRGERDLGAGRHHPH